MACRLMGRERQLQNALQLGTEIKQKIRSQVGQELRCSVGVAHNRFLGKVGSGMQKPDGLVALCASQLPQALFKLKPSDLPGIGRQTNQRLERKGIFTMQQICALSRTQMYDLWGSVWGERLWHLLRGDDWDERSEEHTSELQSHLNLVCRLLLEKKKKYKTMNESVTKC